MDERKTRAQIRMERFAREGRSYDQPTGPPLGSFPLTLFLLTLFLSLLSHTTHALLLLFLSPLGGLVEAKPFESRLVAGMGWKCPARRD